MQKVHTDLQYLWPISFCVLGFLISAHLPSYPLQLERTAGTLSKWRLIYFRYILPVVLWYMSIWCLGKPSSQSDHLFPSGLHLHLLSFYLLHTKAFCTPHHTHHNIQHTIPSILPFSNSQTRIDDKSPIPTIQKSMHEGRIQCSELIDNVGQYRYYLRTGIFAS